jgi:hypothetical protein
MMPKKIFIQLLPEDNGNTCSHSQHTELFPARFEIIVEGSHEPTIDFLCQHHLIVAARTDAALRNALSQLGELTNITDGTFKLDMKKKA